MTETTPPSLFARALVPVASEEDADTTCAAVFPHLAETDGVARVVHVIEKAGGAPDKAPLEARQEQAEAIFDLVREHAAAAGVDVETALLYGTDVAATIVEAADEVDATAIVFTPRGGSRWWNLLLGDVSESIISTSERPVVILPDRGDER